MRLIISCMDRRLNSYIRKNYPNAVVIRNAGANVNSLINTLEKYKNNVDEVVLLPHTDCGAMKVVFSSLKEGKKLTSIVEESLVNQFSSKRFDSLSDLERLNLEIQSERLIRIFGNKVKAELIDVNKIDVPPTKDPYMVYLTKPSPPVELGSNVYVISADDKDIWDSLDIAIYGMRISRVVVNDPKLAEKVKSIYPSVTTSTSF
ncbi:carbonic anhydrase [Sulfolobus tengchongensis]|uniref:Carbonic anhydrase n=1 Tax=Sulfolobus tengchongensis TaxID=207809 RepID=A0AAX4KX22_9CREN